MNPYFIGALLLLVWNIFVFILYVADKQKARAGKWRVSEAALLLTAFIGGGLGASLGMTLLRHKTKHVKFRILVPIAALISCALFGLLFLMGFGVLEIDTLAQI